MQLKLQLHWIYETKRNAKDEKPRDWVSLFPEVPIYLLISLFNALRLWLEYVMIFNGLCFVCLTLLIFYRPQIGYLFSEIMNAGWEIIVWWVMHIFLWFVCFLPNFLILFSCIACDGLWCKYLHHFSLHLCLTSILQLKMALPR